GYSSFSSCRKCERSRCGRSPALPETWCWAGYRPPHHPFRSDLLLPLTKCPIGNCAAFCLNSRKLAKSITVRCSLSALVEHQPTLTHQYFQRLVVLLVAHLVAVLDPVTQVDVGQVEPPRFLYLPQDHVAAQ